LPAQGRRSIAQNGNDADDHKQFNQVKPRFGPIHPVFSILINGITFSCLVCCSLVNTMTLRDISTMIAMESMNISLQNSQAVRRWADCYGRYSSASEYVRELIREMKSARLKNGSNVAPRRVAGRRDRVDGEDWAAIRKSPSASRCQ